MNTTHEHPVEFWICSFTVGVGGLFLGRDMQPHRLVAHFSALHWDLLVRLSGIKAKKWV